MTLQLVLVYLILVIFFYILGNCINNKYKLNFNSFEILIGYFVTFSLFHILTLIPIIRHMDSKVLSTYIIPFILVILIVFILFNYRLLKVVKGNIFLIIIVPIIIVSYFLYDFITAGDASFYIALINNSATTKELYNLNPWNGIDGVNLGFMYYFVSYEAYIASLSNLFNINPTIFTINVVSMLNLTIIITTSYGFMKRLYGKKAFKAFLILLFIFIFLNTSLHGVFFPHNGFNIMTNIYAGKTIYLNAIIVFQFYLLKEIVNKNNYKDILVFGMINIFAAGLTATASYIQLVISICLISYYLFVSKEINDKKINGIILASSLVLLNYLLILFGPNFYITDNVLKTIIASIFIASIIISFYLYRTSSLVIMNNKRLIRRILLAILLAIGLVSIILSIFAIYIAYDVLIDIVKLLPPMKDIIYLYGYNLIVYYVLVYIASKKRREWYQNLGTKFIFTYFPIIIFIVFLNPINYLLISLVITSIPNYHRLFFILPFTFVLVDYLMSIKKGYHILLIGLLMIPTANVFTNMTLIKDTNDHYLYRIDKNVVEVASRLNELDEDVRIFGEEVYIKELRMVSDNVDLVLTEYHLRQHEYNFYQNEELLKLYRIINNQEKYDEAFIDKVLNRYKIDYLIVNSNNTINNQIEKKYQIQTNLSTDSVNVYDISNRGDKDE